MEVLQAFIGTGMPAVIVAVAITRIPYGGRVIRAVALSVREMSYVEAGRASGASAARIAAHAKREHPRRQAPTV
jgi:ABC-type dipeptide/oligopeptide/nickel transport system permease subunit